MAASLVCLVAYVLLDGAHAVLPDSMTVPTTQAGSAPDRTFDYMAFLEQEISDDKAAYAAGNNAYYYTGQGEKDTLGLESPFFDDLRSRGTGLVAHDPAASPSPDDCCSNVGYGNDYFEWDYHKYARVLVGSASVRGVTHEFPSYDRAYWRPDRMVMHYNLEGVKVVERKFVADNDVVSVILTADEDITIDFDGRSFYSNQAITKNATCSVVGDRTIRVTEGGTVWTRILGDVGDDTTVLEGTLSYDGMTTLVASSLPFEDLRISYPEPGVCAYNFTARLTAGAPVTYSWAMHDDYDVALGAISAVVDDAQAHLDAKAAKMNALFADEVPYFRTSDAVVQEVYYFLFAVNLMYYTHKGAGQLLHPFTQTACLNFRGNHGFDNLMHGRVGAWYATKENYATGNLLIWTALNSSEVGLNGMMPDVAGQEWVSGLGGGFYYHAYPVLGYEMTFPSPTSP